MSCEDNKKIVEKFLDRMSRMDLDGVLAMMSDDAKWWVAGKPAEFPIAGMKTKQEMARILAPMGAQLKSPAIVTVFGMIAEGDKVAVEAESNAVAANGRVYNNQYHFLVEIRDGKITLFKEYNDTLHVKTVFMDP